MKSDLDKLQLDLEYGQIAIFDSNYPVLKSNDENFFKYKKIINNSEIALPILLLNFHGIEVKTSQEFLKFKIINIPNNIQSFFKEGNIKKIIDINKPKNLDNSERKIISIYKKLNILPYPIFVNKIGLLSKNINSFNIKEILKSLNSSKIIFRNSTSLPLKNNHNVKILLFDDIVSKSTHYALVFNENKNTKKVNLRIHSSCLTGDLMGSQRCDCGYQLNSAIEYMNKNKEIGIIIYLNQEGRGLGIHNKIISYNIQERGWDTYQADNILGFSGDERDYKTAIKILKYLKVKNVNLITNNPDKIDSIKKSGIKISKLIKIKPGINKFNKKYLYIKKIVGNHLINL